MDQIIRDVWAFFGNDIRCLYADLRAWHINGNVAALAYYVWDDGCPGHDEDDIARVINEILDCNNE